MNDSRTSQSRATGVDCNVTNCKYHTATGHCSASNITVQNESAMKKAETFCSTFTSQDR